MDKMVKAPWNGDQIDNLRHRQAATHLHPYTCAEHSHLPLIPTRSGWVCRNPDCAYRQNWAHADDAAGTWPPSMF